MSYKEISLRYTDEELDALIETGGVVEVPRHTRDCIVDICLQVVSMKVSKH
jgi:hypothetical protein